MNDEIEQWANAVIEEIGQAVGTERAAEFDQTWKAHARRIRPKITVMGPYDAGKTTLLKRLLVEAGEPIPPWMTISARRETFELGEAEALNCAFADAPGIAGGDEQHERVALEALALTDSVLLVLPPQLVTSEGERIADIISGRFFRPTDGWRYPAGAFLIVIARMDEAGPDPADDEAAYRRHADRKLAEVAALTDELGQTGIAALAVPADPYQVVGNVPEPQRADYSAGEGWDGIEGLLDRIRAIPAHADELRAAAHVRYLLYVGGLAFDAVSSELDAIATALTGQHERLDQLRIFESELEKTIALAREGLVRTLEEELARLIGQFSAAEDGLEHALRTRVRDVLAAWQRRWDARITSLAAAHGKELDLHVLPTELSLREATSELEEPPSRMSQGDAAKVKEALDVVKPGLDQGIQGLLEERLGMSFDDAKEQVAIFKTLEAEKIDEYWGKPGAFRNAEQMELAKRYEARAKSVSAIVGIVGDIGAFGAGLWVEKRQEERKYARADRLRETVPTRAHQIAATFLDGDPDEDGIGWLSSVDDLRRQMRQAINVDPDAVAYAEAEHARLTRARDALKAALSGAPSP
jgi:hypothetical protein